MRASRDSCIIFTFANLKNNREMRLSPSLILRRRWRRHQNPVVPWRSISSHKKDGDVDVNNKDSSLSPSPISPADMDDTAPVLRTDEEAIRHLSLLLGRLLSLSARKTDFRQPVVQIEPGVGLITRNLLDHYPRLGIRGIYLNLNRYQDSHDRLSDDYPERYTGCQANFWGTMLKDEDADTVVDLEKVFEGEGESLRREDQRNRGGVDDPLEDNNGDKPFTGATVFGVMANDALGRVVDRFIHSALDPERCVLNRYIRPSTFYFITPSNKSPIDVSDIYLTLPKIESKSRGENLILATGKKYKSFNTNPTNKVRTTLMNCFYDVSAHAAVCPQLLKMAVTKSIKAKASYPYLLMRWTTKKEWAIPVTQSHRRSFGLFVNMLGGVGNNKRVIESVERFVPNVGPTLIMDGGFTMSETVKDLDLDRTLLLFQYLTESPLYGESIFGLVESGRLDADEWLKKRLKFKRGGFVKAKYVE